MADTDVGDSGNSLPTQYPDDYYVSQNQQNENPESSGVNPEAYIIQGQDSAETYSPDAGTQIIYDSEPVETTNLDQPEEPPQIMYDPEPVETANLDQPEEPPQIMYDPEPVETTNLDQPEEPPQIMYDPEPVETANLDHPEEPAPIIYDPEPDSMMIDNADDIPPDPPNYPPPDDISEHSLDHRDSIMTSEITDPQPNADYQQDVPIPEPQDGEQQGTIVVIDNNAGYQQVNRTTGYYDEAETVDAMHVDQNAPIIEHEIQTFDNPTYANEPNVIDITQNNNGFGKPVNGSMEADMHQSLAQYDYATAQPVTTQPITEEIAMVDMATSSQVANGKGVIESKPPLGEDPEFYFKSKSPTSMDVYFAFACLGFLCNIIFGSIALYCVQKGRKSETKHAARKYGCIAVAIAVLGLCVTIGILLAVGFTRDPPWTL